MSGIEEEKGDLRNEEEAIVDRNEMKEEKKGLKCVFVGEFVCSTEKEIRSEEC